MRKRVFIFNILLLLMLESLVQAETDTFTLEVLPVKGSGTINLKPGNYQYQAG
ncbi:MAG: hypothetical protein ACOCRO_01405 [Halanaerobiales bacterium]